MHVPDDPKPKQDFTEPTTSIEENYSDAPEANDHVPFQPFRQHAQPSTSGATENREQFPTYDEPKADVAQTLETLKQIFATKSPELLARAAEKHRNIEDAINEILDSALESTSSSSGNLKGNDLVRLFTS